ncbi:integrase, partial [mine drainage metagenome]
RWIGKPSLVGRTDRHLTAEERREARAPRVRAWSARGVDPEGAVGRLYREDPDTGWMLWLCLRLGLRVREAMLLDPRMRAADHLPVTRGAKNGRTRTIPLTPADNEFLTRFENWLARTGHDRCLIPAGVTEARYRSGYYYRLARHGITKRGLGVTSHGLRHEYAQRLVASLEREFGVGDGMKMVHGTAVPRMADGVALEVSSRLGHARPSITYQYMGRPIDPVSDGSRAGETV